MGRRGLSVSSRVSAQDRPVRQTPGAEVYQDLGPDQWPIVYRPEYNVSLLGLEKLHPFDAGKWGHIFQYLKQARLLEDRNVVCPCEASRDLLLSVHTPEYLDSLRWSWNVARIAEVPPLALVPNFLVQRAFLRPMRYQTAGSLLATHLALQHGWAVNLGGGFHHCCASKGGGFCVYADITIAIRTLINTQPAVSKVMIVDLDAHQGNGHERDFVGDDRIFILDAYNAAIYPRDEGAKISIRCGIPLHPRTGTQEYLHRVESKLESSLNRFQPDLIVYNAGTDILEGDPLGCLNVSAQGVIMRDELVFTKARTRNIPIVMLTSGGYQSSTAKIIADSILNLVEKGLAPKPSRFQQ